MNKFKKPGILVTFIGAAVFVSGCQSSFLTNANDDVATSTLNVLSNKGRMQPI